MRDIVNDKAVGKTTLAVLLGSKGAKVYHYILFVLAYGSLSVLIIWGKESFQLLGLLSIPVIILHLTHLIKVSKVKTPKEFDPMLKVIALSTFVFSIIFSCTLYFA
jgi:1,4-dihydroxy-2-naphthoate octaprenyltransferase